MKSTFFTLSLLFLHTVLTAQTSDPGVTSTGNAGGNHSFRGLHQNGTFSNWMNTGYSGTAFNLLGHSDPHSGYGVVIGNNIVSPVIWMYSNSRNAFSVRTMGYQGDMTSGSDLLTVRSSGLVGIGTIEPTHKLDVRGHGVFKDGSILDIAITTPGGKNGLVFSPNTYGNYSRFNLTNYDNSSAQNRYFQLRFNEDSQGLVIRNGGNVGIGITQPDEKLNINGNLKFNSEYNRILFPEKLGYAGGITRDDGNYKRLTLFHGHSIALQTGSNDRNHSNTRLYINSSGNVGIGTTSPDSNFKLSVNGAIRSKEVKVEANWSDFVFYDDYNLRTLEEVEEHINENGHLPEIPSEEEVTKNGINLGEMDAKLLQKIEELTLYLIEQNKEIKELKEKVLSLENQ